MKEQAPVGQAVLSHIARRAREQATLWLLQAHTQRGKDVRLSRQVTWSAPFAECE